MKYKKMRESRVAPTKLSLPVAVLAALAALVSTSAWAIVIDTGNPDAKLRWDNQIRYNAGWRLEDINSHFANSFGTDETETRFKKHDLVTNRLDLFSELDYTVQDKYGFRVSAALWSENAYPGQTHTGDLINSTFTGASAVPSSYGASGNYSAYAKRYVTGNSGEFVDAFVFGGFELGETSLRFKLGQHNVYWGEALYTVADGVSAGQGPIDTIKAATSPGVEAKELFMPINQLSARWVLTDELSLMGQYQFDWKPYRVVPGGTYFASSDGAGDPLYAGSPVCLSNGVGGTGAACLRSLDAITPGRKGGNFGLAVRWSPTWLDGTAGLYYRKYDEKLPWASMQVQGGLAGIAASRSANGGVRLSYARDTEMIGASLQKNLGPVSAALELSYRRNTALNSVNGFLAGSQGYTGLNFFFDAAAANNIPLNQTPDYSLVEGARGDTMHAVVNAIWLLPKTFLWEAGTLQGEFAYQRLDKVTKNPNVYYAEGYACSIGYAPGQIAAGARNKSDGCATKDSLVFNMAFTPQWLQVAPGLDLSMPTSLSYGVKGNSPTLGGSYEKAYKWSLGLTATYHTLYEFGVAISDQHQDYKTATATSANGVPGEAVISTANGTSSTQNGHRWLSLRFKTSF